MKNTNTKQATFTCPFCGGHDNPQRRERVIETHEVYGRAVNGRFHLCWGSPEYEADSYIGEMYICTHCKTNFTEKQIVEAFGYGECNG